MRSTANPNSDLYWLTGVTQEDTLVGSLFPDNPDPKYREVLVLVRPNELSGKMGWQKDCAGRRHSG